MALAHRITALGALAGINSGWRSHLARCAWRSSRDLAQRRDRDFPRLSGASISRFTCCYRARHFANLEASANAQKLRALALATTAIIYIQLALGATMRHEHRDLSITDFPTAYGQWIPDTSSDAITKINSVRDARGLSDVTAEQIWLQMAHRFGAVGVTVGIIAFFVAGQRETFSPLRSLSGFWVIGIFLQLALGAWTIWSNKAADIATAHVAVGATMFALGVAISAFCLKQQTATEIPLSRRSRLDPVRA